MRPSTRASATGFCRFTPKVVTSIRCSNRQDRAATRSGFPTASSIRTFAALTFAASAPRVVRVPYNTDGTLKSSTSTTRSMTPSAARLSTSHGPSWSCRSAQASRALACVPLGLRRRGFALGHYPAHPQRYRCVLQPGCRDNWTGSSTVPLQIAASFPTATRFPTPTEIRRDARI